MVHGTPRRLAVLVSDLAAAQTPVKSRVRGPPAKNAFGPDGKPTKVRAAGVARPHAGAGSMPRRACARMHPCGPPPVAPCSAHALARAQALAHPCATNQALEGFCKKNGADVAAVSVEADAKGVEYVWVNVSDAGRSAAEVRTGWARARCRGTPRVCMVLWAPA